VVGCPLVEEMLNSRIVASGSALSELTAASVRNLQVPSNPIPYSIPPPSPSSSALHHLPTSPQWRVVAPNYYSTNARSVRKNLWAPSDSNHHSPRWRSQNQSDYALDDRHYYGAWVGIGCSPLWFAQYAAAPRYCRDPADGVGRAHACRSTQCHSVG
jgi:hypothetical protein